jgi:predicted outer membrane lipoprotein
LLAGAFTILNERPLNGHIEAKKVRFELRDPDFVEAWDNCNFYKFFKWILGFLP